MKSTHALLLSTLLFGCNAAVKVDPEGYRCDVGNLCPTGYACREGVCRAGTTIDPSCTNVTCDSPPPTTCLNATTARTFAGRCVSGQCQYDPVDTTCPAGCAQDACVDPCAGVSCVSPPAPACANTTTLRTFAQTGSCAGGSCEYAPTDTTCPNGCQAGRCTGVDLCMSMGVTCNQPPAATCVGSTRRAFAATGTCEPGTGACTYAPSDSACQFGCAQGQCLSASLGFTQTGPRLRFAINGIDVAPGSSGNLALAVGAGGKLARWDGSSWAELQTPSTATLNKVAFVTGSAAWVVGAGRTAWSVRPNVGQVLAMSLSGSGGANLVAVSGRGEGEILLASDQGDWWRLRSGTWSNGSLGSNFELSSAYLDESLRERLAGSCTSTTGTRQRCVGYRFASGGTPTFQLHTQAGTPGFTAVGGSFDVPGTSTNSEAMLGNQDDSLDTHSNLGFFGNVSVSPALEGAGVVGITAQAVNLGRDLFVLTSSADPDPSTPGRGGLFRLSRSLTSQITSTRALETYFGEETLSPNDANGVLVAEVRRAAGLNNVFRRGVITDEALDVGEDFVGASKDDSGALVLASRYGDLITRRPTASTFSFKRPTGFWAIKGLEARNGTGVLLVGEQADGSGGVIVRVLNNTFTTLATRSGTVFHAACRVSDTEGWAVGTGGALYKVTASGATAVTSPTTKDLFTLDCAPGVALAAGADGTVLRAAGGVWSVVPPDASMAGRKLVAARLHAQGAFVAGDGVFLALSPGAGWTALPAKAGLTSLVVRGPQEVYGAFVSGDRSELFRFDGATWGTSLLQVSGALGGGVQAGGQVVWGGTLGAIVEGR